MRNIIMKNNTGRKNILTVALSLFTLIMLLSVTGCYAPSPLYGTWADNMGNKISFTSDGSFNATISSSGVKQQSMGTYAVLKNILTFTRDTGTTTSTEWDIRGNILYLTWLDSDGWQRQLQLYKISN